MTAWGGSRQLVQGVSYPETSSLHRTTIAMSQATSDTRGTLQQLAHELDEASSDGTSCCRLI